MTDDVSERRPLRAVIVGAVVVWLMLAAAPGLVGGQRRRFYWPNPAAAYLIPAILLSVDRWRRASGQRVYWWMAADVAWGSCFWLTDSRAAILVLALVMAVYLVVVPTPRRFWTQFL